MFDVQTSVVVIFWRPRHRSRVLVCMDVVLFFGSALVALKFWSLDMFGLVIRHFFYQWKISNFKEQYTVYSSAESKTVATFRRAKKGHGRTVLGDVGSQDRHAAANSRFATRESRFKCLGAMAWQRQRWHDAMMVRIVISSRHSEFLHFEVSSCFCTLVCVHHVFLFHWIGWEFYNYNLPP